MITNYFVAAWPFTRSHVQVCYNMPLHSLVRQNILVAELDPSIARYGSAAIHLGSTIIAFIIITVVIKWFFVVLT